MAERNHVYTCLRESFDGGESPNAKVPQITVEIRVYWPGPATHLDVALRVDKAVAQITRDLYASVQNKELLP